MTPAPKDPPKNDWSGISFTAYTQRAHLTNQGIYVKVINYEDGSS